MFTKLHSVFPHIVSSPWIVSSSSEETIQITLRKVISNEEIIWNFQAFMNSKKNSCHGNFMMKYGTYIVNIYTVFCTLVIGPEIN